jgi:hypothetical protein
MISFFRGVFSVQARFESPEPRLLIAGFSRLSIV